MAGAHASQVFKVSVLTQLSLKMQVSFYITLFLKHEAKKYCSFWNGFPLHHYAEIYSYNN